MCVCACTCVCVHVCVCACVCVCPKAQGRHRSARHHVWLAVSKLSGKRCGTSLWHAMSNRQAIRHVTCTRYDIHSTICAVRHTLYSMWHAARHVACSTASDTTCDTQYVMWHAVRHVARSNSCDTHYVMWHAVLSVPLLRTACTARMYGSPVLHLSLTRTACN
jgi:hypothetical protein